MRVLGKTLVLAASIAAGSWVSLGRPSFHQAPPVIPKASAPVPDDPPLPQAADPSMVPSFAPWPRTNPEASITKAWAIAHGRTRPPGDDRRLVTFTFDDGPTPDTTPEILQVLHQHHVRATFFVIGSYLEGDKPRAKVARHVLQKLVAAGHLVGNHTHDHAKLDLLSHAEIVDQIDRGAAAIERVIGTRPILFRPPYGRLDEFGEQTVRDRNLELLLWSVEPGDMLRHDPQRMFDDLVEQIETKEGGIVLLHDVRPTTVTVLKRLFLFLRDRPRYQIVDLPQYLRAVAESPPHGPQG